MPVTGPWSPRPGPPPTRPSRTWHADTPRRRGPEGPRAAHGRCPGRTQHRHPRRDHRRRDPARHHRPHPLPGRRRTRPAPRLRHRPPLPPPPAASPHPCPRPRRLPPPSCPPPPPPPPVPPPPPAPPPPPTPPPAGTPTPPGTPAHPRTPTPTGHTYSSTAPPLPGHRSPTSHRPARSEPGSRQTSTPASGEGPQEPQARCHCGGLSAMRAGQTEHRQTQVPPSSLTTRRRHVIARRTRSSARPGAQVWNSRTTGRAASWA